MHQQNLAFKLMLNEKKFQRLRKVLSDYGKITKYFGNSTKKLRRLKEIEIDLDIFLEVNQIQKSITKELKNMVSKSKEAEELFAELNSQEKLEVDLEKSESKIGAAIFQDERLNSVEEKLTALNKAIETLRNKREITETKARELAQVRVQAHKLTRIYEIRMVNGMNKSLKMLYRRYCALCLFMKKQVDAKDPGALRVYRILLNLHCVCRFLCMLDITETLTKSLCLEQIGSVTVLHLSTLNNRLFVALDDLADTAIVQNNKYRFGEYLRKHAAELSRPIPMFKGVKLVVSGKVSKRDRLSAIRTLQNKACGFLRRVLEQRLGLDTYSLACQILLPHKRQTDNHFDKTLPENLNIIINRNIAFIGGENYRRKVELGLKKLIRIFERSEFKDFTDLQVYDAYELIWTQGQFLKELGPDTMALLECVLTDPHSSANCERAGRMLKRILPANRKVLQEPLIDGEMRIGMNAPHERAMNWSFFTNRWFKVLAKGSPISRDTRSSGKSSVLKKQLEEATSKSRMALQCSFYSTIPPRQTAEDLH